MVQVAVTGALIAAPIGTLAATASAQTPSTDSSAQVATETNAADIAQPGPDGQWPDREHHEHDGRRGEHHRPDAPDNNPFPGPIPGIPAPATGSAG
ncbi:hypothetical protein GCM10023318_12720 [Nocardia callitridis]|uniref:Uncharacterized protein n=2 Tax=Nocardia callitridis TaxID=648753 RepID=A0ABP9JXC2_9NOCA